MSRYCSSLQNGPVNNTYLPLCANNKFDNGYNSHIRGFNTENHLTVSAVFPGTEQLGAEAGNFNSSIFIENFGDRAPLVELKRRYDGKGDYNIYL